MIFSMFDKKKLPFLLVKFVFKDNVIKNIDVDCKEVLGKFKQKAFSPAGEKLDYDKLRHILKNKLQKHRNEPNND